MPDFAPMVEEYRRRRRSVGRQECDFNLEKKKEVSVDVRGRYSAGGMLCLGRWRLTGRAAASGRLNEAKPGRACLGGSLVALWWLFSCLRPVFIGFGRRMILRSTGEAPPLGHSHSPLYAHSVRSVYLPPASAARDLNFPPPKSLQCTCQIFRR